MPTQTAMLPGAQEVMQGLPFSRSFLSRAQRVKASSDPDTATAQTVEIMCGHIHKSAQDPLIAQAALEAIKTWRGGPQFASMGRDVWADPLAQAESVWWWAKHAMKFVHHSHQILVWLGERDQLQLLIEPSVLVRMRQMEGDCAIYSMLICAMLESLGIDWELQTLSTNPTQPDIYNHVFLRVVLPDGRRIPFDCSHGQYPGWRVPENNVLRSQVWDEQGNAIADEAAGPGLGDYVRNPNPWWFTGGLGDDSTDGNTTVDLTIPGQTAGDTSGSSFPSIADLNASAQIPLPSEVVIPGTNINATLDSSSGLYTTSIGGQTAMVAPNQSSAAWAAFATALTKAGVQLATIATIQPGTAVLPNGTVVSVPPGQSLQGTFGNLFAGAAQGQVMPIMMLGFGAILILSLVGGRR